MGNIYRTLFGVSARETSFARRGFSCPREEARRHLEEIGAAFIGGYNAALTRPDPARLTEPLNTVPIELRGFAYEGAAMGLALLDCLTPWRRGRLAEFLDGPAEAHVYMVHVGAGWALARLRRSPDKQVPGFDPVYRWLAVDGYGFHQGYFHPARTIDRQAAPRTSEHYATRAFDQGVGRSMWFVLGTEVTRIAEKIGRFPLPRRADLWSGVGLACAYAGGIEDEEVLSLRRLCGPFLPEAAQGAAFAAKARLRAGTMVAHAERACQILCDRSAEEAAALTDLACDNLPDGGPQPAYEIWRQRIQANFKPAEVVS